MYSSCFTPLPIVAFISQQEYQFLSVLCTVVAVLHYQLRLLFHNRNISFFCSVYSSCFTPLPIVAFISQQEYHFILFCVQWLLYSTTNCGFYFTTGISVSFCSVYSSCFTPLPIVAFISQQEYQFLSVLCTVVALLHYQLWLLFHNRNISFFLF